MVSFWNTEPCIISLFNVLLKSAFCCTSHSPSCGLYHIPHFSQILCLTCFKSPSPHNEVSRQKSEWQDVALRGVRTFFCSIHPPPSSLTAPFTPEVHWMMGNAVYVWQIWVDCFQSPPLLPLCLLLQRSRELPPLAYMHQEMCTSVLWL